MEKTGGGETGARKTNSGREGGEAFIGEKNQKNVVMIEFIGLGKQWPWQMGIGWRSRMMPEVWGC